MDLAKCRKKKSIVGKITKNHYGITKEALFHAIEKKNHRELKRILESGIDVNIRDKDGSTPLINAAYYNDIEAVKILISFNADLELSDYDGNTALMYAAMKNCKEAGDLLLSEGAIVNTKNNIDGYTAVDIAHEYYPSDNDYFLSDKLYSCDIFRNYYRNQAIAYSYGTIINLKKLQEDFKLCFSMIINIEQINEIVRAEITKVMKPEQIEIINGSNDNELQIVPSKKVKRNFLNLFIKEQEIGSIISLKDLKKKYKKEFNCSLSTKFIYKFIDDYNAYPKDFNLRILGKDKSDTQILFLPTYQDAKTIISDYFSKKEIGYTTSISSINKLLFQNCLTDTEIRNYTSTYNNITKLVTKDNKIIVYPSNARIDQFCEEIFLKHAKTLLSRKDIEKEFESKFQVSLINLDLFSFITKFNQKNTPGIIDTQNEDEEQYLILPTKTDEISFYNRILSEFLSNKTIGFRISYLTIQNYIFKKCNICLSKEELSSIINDYNRVNNSNIKEQNDEFLLLPTTNEINEFLNNLINEQFHNQPIQISFLNQEFKKKFLIELDNKTIENFLFFFAKNNKALEIREETSTELVIGLKKEKIDAFLNSIFKDKEFGFQIEIPLVKEIFQSQTTYDLPDESLNNYLSCHKNIEKIQTISNKTVLSIVPSENDILDFIESTFTPGEYKKVYVEHIKDIFTHKYSIPFPVKYLDNSFLSRRKIMLEVDDNYCKTLYQKPSYSEVENFLKNIFFSSSYTYKEVSINEINRLYFRRFSSYFGENDLSDFLENYPNVQLISSGQTNTLYCVYPNEEELDGILLQYIRQGSLNNIFTFSFEEIQSSIHSKYTFTLSESSLIKWIKTNSSRNYSSGYEIEVLPKNVFIRRPIVIDGQYIQKIFDKSLPQQINHNLSKPVMQQLGSSLSKYGLSLRNKRNSNEIILTYEISSALDEILTELSPRIRELFLRNIVGYSVSTYERNDFYKVYTDFCSKYDIELDNAFYSKLVEKANEDLLDIKIIYDKQKNCLQSEFKSAKAAPHTVDGIECPVCRNRYNEHDIGSHILNRHTSNQESTSILTRNALNTFYCHHCKSQNIPLNGDTYIATIQHLRGICMEKENNPINKKTSENTNQEKRIWQGSAYSNNSVVLGNSGQLLRDNGRFGSFPSEDYYGDGDSNI